MKILYVLNSLTIGGAERMIVELSKEMSKLAEVYILSLNSTNNNWGKSEFTNYNVKLIEWNCTFYNLLNSFKLLSLIKKERFDIVHTHLTYAQLYTAIVSCMYKQPVYITTEHSSNNNRRSKPYFRYLDQWLYSRYYRILSISKTAQIQLLEWLRIKNNEKYFVFPNAVDIQKFAVSDSVDRLSLNLSKDDIILMMVGRLADAKDPTTIMHALHGLPDKYKFVIVGDGPYRNKFEMDAAKIGVAERVIFVGAQTNVPTWLKMADIYIQSSHWEGMPTAVLEAMAANIITIASDVPGNNDLLPRKMLFEHQNAEELKELILKEKSGWRFEQHQIVCNYDLSSITQKLYNVYTQLLNSSK